MLKVRMAVGNGVAGDVGRVPQVAFFMHVAVVAVDCSQTDEAFFADFLGRMSSE